MVLFESNREREMELKVKLLSENGQVPSYAHPGDAGLDLRASEALVLEPGAYRMVRTGISIELPAGTEGQVRPLSGLAAKHGISVVNTPGTIDEGYRGEVGVILINHGSEPFSIHVGDRIAQLLVKPVLRVDVSVVEALSDTARGEGGFGSTGVSG
jgi:dUTP pyrophosphatase